MSSPPPVAVLVPLAVPDCELIVAGPASKWAIPSTTISPLSAITSVVAGAEFPVVPVAEVIAAVLTGVA